jgi:hypothetical protein
LMLAAFNSRSRRSTGCWTHVSRSMLPLVLPAHAGR